MHTEDGSDAGEAAYAVLMGPCEEILTGDGWRLRVRARSSAYFRVDTLDE